MGNRAVITTAPYKPSNLGIYLHWNGGRASIEGFLKAARELEYRTLDGDDTYALARLTGAIALYFGGSLSLGIGKCSNLDANNMDNGTYLVGNDWQIVGRHFFDGGEEEVDQAKTDEICDLIVRRTKAAAEVTE